MAFLSAGLARKSNSTLEIFKEIYGSRLSKAGVNVTWETAIKVATVLACARVIAQGIAQVPLKVYLDANGRKEPARDHPLYFLLHNQPNPWQTSFEYRETMALHLVLGRAHYSYKVYLGRELKELIPIEPHRVEPKRAKDGTITYLVTNEDGSQRELAENLVWHVRGMGWNGWQGLDAVDLAREAVGLSIAAEQQHAKMFANGVRPSGVYSVDGVLGKEQQRALRQFLIDGFSGEKAGLPMVVDRGAKWLPMAMTGVDSQHLEVRKLQVEEVCRAMGVMPIMVGFSDKTATYASAEQMFLAHVVHTLTPWYTRIEQSIDAHLIGRRDVERGYYAKFVVAGLLRGAMKDRAEYLSKALGAGGSPAWMTQDEARALEEMNPMGGDAAALPQPTNVAAAGQGA